MTYPSQNSASAKEVLEHHGIKGMKWGVRKEASSSPEASAAKRAARKATIRRNVGNVAAAGFAAYLIAGPAIKTTLVTAIHDRAETNRGQWAAQAAMKQISQLHKVSQSRDGSYKITGF